MGSAANLETYANNYKSGKISEQIFLENFIGEFAPGFFDSADHFTDRVIWWMSNFGISIERKNISIHTLFLYEQAHHAYKTKYINR